ncbi:hypothetical protein TNCV_94171 [Trichonephila clavipes]|nr:hypothetical protein TNCV_94171 [Trichonephila clavipes]
MQYHGVPGIMINGRTRLRVVANGIIGDGPHNDTLMKFSHIMLRLFRGAVGDKFFLWTTTQKCHRTLAVQDCQTARVFNVSYGQRSPDLNPIENGCFGRQSCWSKLSPPTNKNTLIRALTEEWDKLPQQLLDNVVQSMVYDVWNVASHSTVDISRTDTFFKVPADF